MGDRSPYEPPLERVAECVCEAFPIKSPLSTNQAAQTCGEYHSRVIDPRTLERYVGRDKAELNLRTSKKCGKKVQGACVKEGFEIVQSLDGALKDGTKRLPNRPLPEDALDDEDVAPCLAEPENRVNSWVLIPPLLSAWTAKARAPLWTPALNGRRPLMDAGP